MEDIPKEKPAATLFQIRLSLVLTGLLVLIAVAVVWTQRRYDPADWREIPGGMQPPAQEDREMPTEGVEPLSAAERYNADNLSDKINGKAGLYLGAGFKAMESRRFSLAADKNRWMERYVYEMGGHPNAFAVYSIQRRKVSHAIDITPHGYLASNGLFLVHGPYYVEIIASEASAEMQAQLKALAAAFVNAHDVTPEELYEISLFGPDHIVKGSTKLIADSAFGIQGMDWVYTATYADGQSQATAFIARRLSAASAESSAETFISFWNEYGAEPVATPRDIPAARIVLILDNYEMVMVQGAYLYGVHEATHLEFGLKVLSQLQKTVREAAP